MKMTRKQFLVASTAALTMPALAAAPRKKRIVAVKGSDVFAPATSAALLERLLAERNDAVFVDLQDSVTYPSHPEIATPKSQATEKVKESVAFYKDKGVELLPLVDFATNRDAWLGEYDRMVCSKPYRRVVEDVIRDVYGIFGHPQAIHIGFENENVKNVQPMDVAIMRQGDLWMREFNWTVGLVESTGATCWAWFDYPWGIRDFTAGCPRGVTLVNLKPLDAKLEAKLAQLERMGIAIERREVAE